MRHLQLFLKALPLIVACVLAAAPAAPAQRVINQPQFGKQTIEVGADEVITFYDMNGYKGISSSTSNNSQSLTVFKPAEGMAIRLTFEALDIRNDGASWPAYVNVYAGDPDADNSFTYATATSGVTASSTLPAGNVLEKLDGTYSDKSYTATDASGIIAVGYLYRYGKQCAGWKATVQCITLDDQTVTGASSDYSAVVSHPDFTTGVNFATARVSTTGVMNADVVTGISFRVSGAAVDPLKLRLYRGAQASMAGASSVHEGIAADGDGYTFTLHEALAEGDNAFSIAGEFAADATPGTTAQVEITKITTVGQPEGITPFTAATAVAVAKPAIARIALSPQTVVVGDVPYNFYDDGGKDGNITQGFEGQITFVPATEGYAIKIDFSKLDLFNTSSTSYNDVCKFYNGREVNEENLNTTLLTEAELVKSTAADGSLTVYLKSTTGYPKSGWEAVVSQFLPGNMTFSEVTATADAEAASTVSAGDSGAKMLVLDVVTDNQASPLSLESISLSTATPEAIDAYTVYSLGKKNTFSTADVFATGTVGTGAITAEGGRLLAEGHNYFAVVVAVADDVDNGDELQLAVSAVTVEGTEHALATPVAVTRTVNNVCRATAGSHSHNISGLWTFTNTEGYSSDKYETQNTDYVVTFVPTVENSVAEIDFSAFDVYYASSSYGTRAVFEIYSGREVNASNILWKLESADAAKVGPGRKLRSTAADGSLTIRFNPNTSSSYSAGRGWTATVRPFVNHDMEIKSVTVNQTSADVVAVGVADAALLDFAVETEGTLSLKTVKAVNVDLKESQSALSKVSVYYNNENNRETAVLFGSVENPTESAVTIAGERALADGMNYFWLAVDVKADAAAESVVDARLVSLVDINDAVTTVAEGDPEGSRVVKYLYIIQSGSQVVTVTEPLLFYDDGGKDGKLTKGFKGTVTFVPGRDNSAVQVNTNSFSIGSGKMYVYSGREVNQDNILGTVTGYSTTTGPANLVSKAEDGSLTIDFAANTTASTLDGWEMEVSLHEKTPFAIDEIEIDNSVAPAMRNGHDAVMQQLALVVSGDKEPFTISGLTFSTEGTTATADIAAAKVYYTGHTALFGNDRLLGSVTAPADGENTITFDTPLTIADNGNHYLWLCYDVAPDAGAGNTVAARVLAVGDRATAAGEAATRTVKAGLSGEYIIGGDNADYATIEAALTALAEGVEGAVTFKIADGTYAENLRFGNVPGVGEINTVTFTSLSGNRDRVTITGSGQSENVPGSTAYYKGMVFVENTPYVTLESLTFAPAKESAYNYVVQGYDRCHHFTLRDCHVKATPVTSGYSGINLVQMTVINEEGHNNDFVTIENNQLDGGYIALNVGGTAYLSLSMERGLVVRGNTISEAGSKGIYVNPEIAPVIENNTIYQSQAKRTGYWGIDANRCRGAFVIAGNKITSETEYYSGGINLRSDAYGYADAPGRVYNNAIAITKAPSTSAVGIQLEPSTHHVLIAHNSVNIEGSAGYAFYTSNSASGAYADITLQNNLMRNATTDSPVMFVGDRWFSGVTFTNNDFYAASGNVKADTGLDAFNALDNAEATIAVEPQFMAATNLHLTAADGLNVATPLSWLTVDADGVARDAQAPTLGAYEYVEVVDTKPALAEDYPRTANVTDAGAEVITKWNVAGKLYSKIEKAETPAGGKRLKAVNADDLLATTPVNYIADAEVTTAFTDLEPTTDYVAYFLAVNDLGTRSDIVTAEFTTARHIEPLTATAPAVAATVDSGESATLAVTIAGGDEPYTIEWRDQMNNVVGNEPTVTVTPDHSYAYRVTVASADGQQASAKTAVIVRGDAVAATFDDNYLPDESFFNGDNDDDTWYSGSYAFAVGNAIWPGSTTSFWYDYALSNQTADTYAGLNDQYHSVTGGGRESDNFVIAYPQGGTITVTHDVAGDVIPGFYITNTAYAYNALVGNVDYARAMRQGDWFKVTVKDVDNADNSLDFYLSDFRSDNEADHYNLNTWEWVDLTPLGNVKGVTFTLSGTDMGQYGFNTPAYFAMDDFGGEPDMADETFVVKAKAGQKVPLERYFSYADDGATATYKLDGALDTEAMTITLDADNRRLVVDAQQDRSESTIVVAMTQKGHTQRVRLTVKVDNVTAIDNLDATDADVISVTYVNAAGQVSTKPWQGVNIVVTRHADGSVTTAKRLVR